jgi:hypothetical protein
MHCQSRHKIRQLRMSLSQRQTTGTRCKGRAGGRQFLSWNWNEISQCVPGNWIPTAKSMSVTSLIQLACLHLLISGNRCIIMLPQYTSTILTESLTHLTCNQEERDLDLDWDTDYSDWSFFRSFHQYFLAGWQLEIGHNRFFSSSWLINYQHV